MLIIKKAQKVSSQSFAQPADIRKTTKQNEIGTGIARQQSILTLILVTK